MGQWTTCLAGAGLQGKGCCDPCRVRREGLKGKGACRWWLDLTEKRSKGRKACDAVE